jgi:acyl-CoA synthetase (AMP-forming)/AMP-acid ligase II
VTAQTHQAVSWPSIARSPVAGTFSTLAELAAAVAEQFPDHDAIMTEDETLSFGQWWTESGRLAGELHEHGLGEGGILLILLPTSIDYAVSVLAATRLGAIPTGLNSRLGRQEIASIIEHAEPSLILTNETLAERLPRTSSARVVVRERIEGAGVTPPMPAASADAPAVIMWTSGSTGLPKGVWFSHTRLRGIAGKAGDLACPFDRRLSSTSFAHAGFMARLWEQFAYVMALTVTPEPWDPAAVVRLLRSKRITVLAGVPTQWTKLLQLAEFNELDLSALRIATISTAPSGPELLQRIHDRLGVPVITRYSSTETATATGTRTDDPPDVAFRTVGRPNEGVELLIAKNDEGVPAEPGDVGEVWIRHDSMMNGYWNDPVRTAEVITTDGWLITGDLGRMDEAGNLVLAGRKRDMYIRGGYNIYPLEVENVLGLHPKVDQVAVIGVDAPVIGEIGIAVVVAIDAHDPPSLEELRTWSHDHLADYKAPDEVRIVGELPRNATMKVDKLALHAWLARTRS